MRSKLNTFKMMTAIFLTLTYLGCGGGGGSGDGGGESSGITYSGITTQARVEENNATDLASGAFAAGETGSVFTGFAALKENKEQNDLQIDTFRTLKIPSIFADCLRSVDLAPPLYTISLKVKATHTETGKENGPCGGNFSYTISIDDVTGRFSGSFTFANYCDQGVTLSGLCRVRGTADPNTGDIITATFSTENLSDETMILDVDMSMDFSVSPMSCAIDGYFKDKATGLVYWIRDYTVYITEYSGYEEVDIFGTFYHPDYGYVFVSTLETFTIYDGDDWPSSGALKVEGINSTKAILTTIDILRCRVEADTDGDGNYDCDSGILNWTDYEAFDEIHFTGSRLNYSTYSDSTPNRYQGWVEFLNDDFPIRESDITNVVLRDQDQNEIEIVQRDFDDGEIYVGGWNSDTHQVDFSGPSIYSGFSINFSEGTTITSGYYTYETTTRNGNNLSDTQYFPGKLELMVVDSESMNSEWIGGDLKLTWTNPDPGGSDKLVVQLFSEENGFELYLTMDLPNTASEVTIPEEWVNKVKQLSESNVMSWYVQLRVSDDTTNNNYARSRSDSKTIVGW